MRESDRNSIKRLDFAKHSLKLLIQLSDYGAAATAVAEFDALLEASSLMIKRQIELDGDGNPKVISALRLQVAFDFALAEVFSHIALCSWVAEAIPAEDNRAGINAPLDDALKQSTLKRTKLVQEINEALDLLNAGE